MLKHEIREEPNAFRLKYETRDSDTYWLLPAIHANQKRNYRAIKLNFWDKLLLWLKGKL